MANGRSGRLVPQCNQRFSVILGRMTSASDREGDIDEWA